MPPSARCSTLTAVPVAPVRSTTLETDEYAVPAAGLAAALEATGARDEPRDGVAAVLFPIRAFHVEAATTPLAVSFLRLWNARTEPSVFGPNWPSAVIFSAFWSATTAAPVDPRRSVVLEYF